MKLKFTLIDYIIIILIIIAVVFAFIHITSDDSSDMQKTAFDESTTNKIPDTYLKYYKDGFIVNATVEGFNSTNGERVTINGNVVWLNYDNGADTRLLIQTDSGEYLTGLYRYNPNADIYIDHISLESNGVRVTDSGHGKTVVPFQGDCGIDGPLHNLTAISIFDKNRKSISRISSSGNIEIVISRCNFALSGYIDFLISLKITTIIRKSYFISHLYHPNHIAK